MELFPSPEALAKASVDEVNAAWAGLGFYGRARRLHEGAKYVVEQHGGEVPSDLQELLRIPGVGPYTAGAIRSIAFGERAAVVDGNVIRVFARLRVLEGDSSSPALLKLCWSLAEELVDAGDPGAFNQALMELGATVCTPQAPACDRCPVSSACHAFQQMSKGAISAVTDFPARPSRKQKRLRRLALAAVEVDGSWLLMRRPMTGLLAGQLEFPSVELSAAAEISHKASLSEEEGTEAAAALQDLLSREASLPSVKLTTCDVMPLEHVFSHEHHVMHVFLGKLNRPAQKKPSGNEEKQREVFWMTPQDAKSAGATSGLRKVFDALASLQPTLAKRQKTSLHQATID